MANDPFALDHNAAFPTYPWNNTVSGCWRNRNASNLREPWSFPSRQSPAEKAGEEWEPAPWRCQRWSTERCPGAQGTELCRELCGFFLHPWPISPSAASAVLLALCTVAAWKLYHSPSHKHEIQMHFTHTHTRTHTLRHTCTLTPPYITCNSLQVPCELLKDRNQAHTHTPKEKKNK